jgi:hypothetical protein
MKPIELGCPGHLIVARHCQWRRHTQVGNYRVSTVGNYFPPRKDMREPIGAGADALFETMVFRTTSDDEPESEGCGCKCVESYSEIDGERYATSGAAQAGHERYVAKFLKRAKAEGR